MSEMICALAPGAEPTVGDSLCLGAEESHHLVRVRRAGKGSEVWAINGGGTAARCRLVDPDTAAAILRVEEVVSEWREPARRVVLFQALVRPAEMDRIVEKGTALGVRTIVPLETARMERKGIRLERWRRLAAESAKQCGRGRIPAVEDLCTWAGFVKRKINGTLLVAYSGAERGLREYVAVGNGPPLPEDDLALLVGPEGDMTPRERAILLEKGVLEVHLGPRRLRSEDAALKALALLLPG